MMSPERKNALIANTFGTIGTFLSSIGFIWYLFLRDTWQAIMIVIGLVLMFIAMHADN